MKTKVLALFLCLQVLAIVVAGLSFQVIESRLIAGMVAGAYFIGSGLFMIIKTWPFVGKWKLLYWYPLLVHVFVISIPMVATRLWFAGYEFSDVKILGLEGPVFHRLSTTVFSLLIVGTILDIARNVWKERRAKRPALS